MTRKEITLLVGSIGLVLATAIALWLHFRDGGRFPAIPGPGELEPAPSSATPGEPSSARGSPTRSPFRDDPPYPAIEKTPRAAPSASPDPERALVGEPGTPGSAAPPGPRVPPNSIESFRTGDPRGSHLERLNRGPVRTDLHRNLRSGSQGLGTNRALKVFRPQGLPTEEPAPAAPASRDGGFVDAPPPAGR